MTRAKIPPMPSPTTDREPIEPLFAHDKRRWLRVWGLTQSAALLVACGTMIGGARGRNGILVSGHAGRAIALFALLIVYHVVGLRAHDWIMRRRWAVATFVPLGWAIILASLSIASGFSLLVLGAVIQGFIFLPFSWAIATLTLVMTTLIATVIGRAGQRDVTVTVAATGTILAMGIMIGTVMAYINHVNRDSAIRARLLKELDEAQRDLAERAKEAGVMEERQRLARDIHDTLAQGFASVVRHLEAIELSFTSHETASDMMHRAAPHLAHAQDVSRTSLAEIRRLVWALRPTPLAESTLGAAIERIVAAWSEANGVLASCVIDALPPLTPDAEVVFLRATQEALSNVARHAGASKVAVTLHAVDGVVLLGVEDDGRGFANADGVASGRMGLAGMRERVRPFGGHVMIDSAIGSGTSVTIALPLPAISGAVA